MALSDDVASLKLEIHKLAVAIEELAIKRYSQGEIGISNLPWFTPQYVPGDSIKLSGNRLPAATYLDNNEVIASSTSSFSNARSTFLGAHQLFEKMPEPMLSSNNDQVAVIGDRSLLNEIDEIKPGVNGVPEPYIDDVPDYVRTAHKLFHTMPVPDFILEMANVARTTQEENEKMTDAHQLFDTMPEPTEQANANQTICQAEVINNEIAPSKAFDELPLPDFIKEIVEASKIAELNSAQGNSEAQGNSDTICEDSDDDSLAFKENFAKLGTLDGPYFPELVILGASRGRLFRLRSVVLMGNQTSDQLLVTDELYDRNLTPKCPLFQVKNDSLMVLYALPSMSLAKIVLLPLLLGDLNWFMGTTFSANLGVKSCNTRAFESVVSRKTFFTFKELFSWGIRSLYCHWPWLDLPFEAQNILARCHRGYNSSDDLISCIFIYDPGDLLFGATSSDIGFCSRYNSRTYMIVDHFGDVHDFDSGGNINSSCGYKLWQVGQLLLFLVLSDSMPCHIIALHDLVNDKILASITLPKWNNRPWLSTLEDKGDFRGEEDKVYSLEVFDPGGECLRMICEGLNYVFTSSLNRLSSKCDEGIEAQFKIFDPGLMLANVATSKPVDVSNNYVPLPCHHACIGSDNKLSFQMKNYDLKGMKMIKITRFGQSYLAIRWRMSNLICIMNHLATSGSILMTMTCSSLCFDPGGLQNKFCVVILIVLLMRVAACIESTSVWIFDPGEIDDLSGPTSIMSILYLVYGVGINSDGTMYLMFFSHHENDLFQGGVAWVHHGLVSINSDKMSKSLPSHFIVGHMKQLSATEYYMISTHSHPPMDYTSMLLGYGNKDQNASIFIFDPGGFKCWLSWLKMMKILEAYQNNGRNSEDYQIYVFDPGGPLIRLVMDAIPGMCYATSSFKHRLSLILEDKDRFKRRVLIHIKMRLRVAWSLYLLFLISQVISSLYKSISYLVIINQ